MTALTNSKPTNPGYWAKFLHGFRALDEALHYDPADAQQRRIERLEVRLEELESSAHAGAREDRTILLGEVGDDG